MNGDEPEFSQVVRLVVVTAALGRVTGPAGPIAAVRATARVPRVGVVLASRALITRDGDDAFTLARVAGSRGEEPGVGRVGDAAHASTGGAGDDVHDYSLREKRLFVKFCSGRIEFRQQITRLPHGAVHDLNANTHASGVVSGILTRVLQGIRSAERVERASLVANLDDIHKDSLQPCAYSVNL